MKRIRKIETSVGLTGNVANNASTSTTNAYSCNYINTELDNKVNKDGDKILSTNDFTDTLKDKLDGVATGATKNTVENSLTSTSTTNALSAAKGKELSERSKYSTTEQSIGTWYDGKTIYRKVIEFSSNRLGQYGEINISLGVTISDLVRANGYWIDATWSNRKNPISTKGLYNAAYDCAWQIVDNNKIVLRFDGGTANKVTGKLFIEYTK